jgi:hypothetical protein
VPGGKSRRSSLLTFVAKPNSPNERRIFGLHLKNVSDDGSGSNSSAPASERFRRDVAAHVSLPRYSIFNEPADCARSPEFSRQKNPTLPRPPLGPLSKTSAAVPAASEERGFTHAAPTCQRSCELYFRLLRRPVAGPKTFAATRSRAAPQLRRKSAGNLYL